MDIKLGITALLVVASAAGCASPVPPTVTTSTAPPIATQSPALIPQPAPPDGLPIAAEGDRVDLVRPLFSDPTRVDNPLFPVSDQASALLLGEVDGQAFRAEVTLLPYTRVVDWAGQRIEALVSQYVAFLDGRIAEVAYDYYAQDDAGNVWYLGEDVHNFANGVIADTHGTWIAGIDAPGAMIMPADPQVGDVYRPENAPGLVFEEVTVGETGVTLDGAFGPIEDGIVVEELHMDGGTEQKEFAPGYGEFYTAAGGDVEALVLAVPTDALSTPAPTELQTLTDAALRLIDEARAEDWEAAETSLLEIEAAWPAMPSGESPARVADAIDSGLADLARTLEGRDSAAAQLAAIELARSAFDIALRHVPVSEVDLGRLALWSAQARLDAETGEATAVSADLFALDYVRDRLLATLAAEDMATLNTALEEMHVAFADGDLEAIANMADALASDGSPLRWHR